MRKIISMGVIALMLSIFSGQLLAGKIPVCEAIKEDPAYKGLYGLCNAYWNADNEVAKAAILANFEEKAGTANGGPGMPGLEDPGMACPCWAGVVLEDVDLYTPAAICFLNIPPDGDDIAFFGDGVNTDQTFLTNGVDCGYSADYIDGSGSQVLSNEVRTELGAEGQVCQDEFDDIVNEYFASCIEF